MTDNETPQFVKASELYSVTTGARYPHPDQQATDEEIARKFDFDRQHAEEPDAEEWDL
jgi:hypothetical protein